MSKHRSRMTHVLNPAALVFACCAALLFAGPPRRRRAITFAGKTVTMIIGFGPGGGYDTGAAWWPVTSASTCQAIRP